MNEAPHPRPPTRIDNVASTSDVRLLHQRSITRIERDLGRQIERALRSVEESLQRFGILDAALDALDLASRDASPFVVHEHAYAGAARDELAHEIRSNVARRTGHCH